MDAQLALLGCSGCGGAGKGEGAERHMTVLITSGLCMLCLGTVTAAPAPLSPEVVWVGEEATKAQANEHDIGISDSVPASL